MSGPPPGFNATDSLLPDPGPSAAPIHVMRGGGVQTISEEDKKLLEKYGLGDTGILKGKIDEKVKTEFLTQLKSGKCSVGTGDMVVLKKDCWAVSMVIRELLKAGIQRTNKMGLGFKPKAKPDENDNKSQTDEERNAENAETPESLTITIEEPESTEAVSEIVNPSTEATAEATPGDASTDSAPAADTAPATAEATNASKAAPETAPAEETKPAPAEETKPAKTNNKKQGGLRVTRKKKHTLYKTKKETRQRSKSRYARRTRRSHHK
jgi:hypothetical protein